MAYPDLYNITYSYTGFQQAQGDNNFPGTQLDADLNGLEAGIFGLSAFMQNVVRSDGKLHNGIVTYDSLSPALQTAGLEPADAWAPETEYESNVSVIDAASLYRSNNAHTSGSSFADDLAAGHWLFIAALVAGPPGEGATIEIGTVTTLPPGSPATVTNSGTLTEAVFDFGVPEGEPGEDGAGGVGSSSDYESVAAVQAATIPSGQNSIRTAGYYAAGDLGGALYKKVLTQPSHNGKIQSADGAWWAIAETVLNPLQFGAKGDGTTDDAPACRSMFAANPNGGKVSIPRLPFLLDSVVGGHVFTFANNAVTIEGEGYNASYTGAGFGGSCFLLGSSIPDTADIFRFAGTAAVLGTVLRNFAIFDATNVYGSGFGRHAIHIDATGQDNYYQNQMEISRLFISNMKTGVSIKSSTSSTNSGGGAICFSKIADCTVMSMDFARLGDNVNIEHNTFGQNAGTSGKPGLRFDNVAGATSTNIVFNVLSNFNGMVICDGGTNPVIAFNEFEQAAGFGNTYGSVIDIRGATAKVVMANIFGNSISQNSATANYIPLRIQNATATRFSKNRIGIPSTAVHVDITSAADHTVGFDNYYTVADVLAAGVITNADPTHTSAQLPTGVGPDTLVSRTSADVLTNKSFSGQTGFVAASNTTVAALFASPLSPGDYVPNLQVAYGTAPGAFTGVTMWSRSAGDNAFGSWAKWNPTTDRWEYPLTSTYGATLQTFNDNLAGDINYYTAPNISVTAGNPITFTQRLSITGAGNVVVGGGALATTATNGFFYTPGGAGVPTGVPTAFTGRVPMYYDTTNNKLYVYNGAWKSVAMV